MAALPALRLGYAAVALLEAYLPIGLASRIGPTRASPEHRAESPGSVLDQSIFLIIRIQNPLGGHAGGLMEDFAARPPPSRSCPECPSRPPASFPTPPGRNCSGLPCVSPMLRLSGSGPWGPRLDTLGPSPHGGRRLAP